MDCPQAMFWRAGSVDIQILKSAGCSDFSELHWKSSLPACYLYDTVFDVTTG